MSQWSKNTKYTNVFTSTGVFNGCKYEVNSLVEETGKSIKFWFTASSGKKRSDLEVFEQKDRKSDGGMKALLWIRDRILGFNEFYNESAWGRNDKRARYLVIAWSDSRRRDIYSRLERYGFRFMVMDGNKVLVKKI